MEISIFSAVAVRGGILASTRAGQNFSVSPSTPGEVDESEHGLLYRSRSTLYLLAYFTCTFALNAESLWCPLNFYFPSPASAERKKLGAQATPGAWLKRAGKWVINSKSRNTQQSATQSFWKNCLLRALKISLIY
jgi:hypothetical protein